jgi:hypothetical protein
VVDRITTGNFEDNMKDIATMRLDPGSSGGKSRHQRRKVFDQVEKHRIPGTLDQYQYFRVFLSI